MNILNDIQGLSEIEQLELLQNMLISIATGGTVNADEYQIIRGILTKNSIVKNLLPTWVKTNRDVNQFWQFIKYKFSTYDERRQYIWKEFAPAFSSLEGNHTNPSLNNISDNLKQINNDIIYSTWKKALQRTSSDPEGAITSARTLIESICKYILDERNILYNETSLDLSELYKLVASELNLAPEQHNERIFKQILGGCSGVINGLGTLRNKLGDAHGVSGNKVRPLSRHATLAVNLAGTMSTFLLDTHLAK